MSASVPAAETPGRFHDLLIQEAPAYLERFGARMPPRQKQVLQRLVRCRTPALGGALFVCRECGTHHFRYHSCNDRHCPRCGQADADLWWEKHSAWLLPVDYFLVTFTVPEGLRDWIRSHPQLGCEALFATSARALQDLAANPQRLGAQLGMLGVLHTWSRTLSRYVFQTATGNRIVPRLPGGQVRWNYRQSQTGHWRALVLEPPELVRRFLQHVLPSGFHRVRRFGWLHPAAKAKREAIQALLTARALAPLLSPDDPLPHPDEEVDPFDELEIAESFVEARTLPRVPLAGPFPRCPRCD